MSFHQAVYFHRGTLADLRTVCGSLELQSKSIVAGSVRMVYAIIYSLFLGFGITIGTAIYGLIDPRHATSATQCKSGMPQYYAFLFVPPFTLW